MFLTTWSAPQGTAVIDMVTSDQAGRLRFSSRGIWGGEQIGGPGLALGTAERPGKECTSLLVRCCPRPTGRQFNQFPLQKKPPKPRKAGFPLRSDEFSHSKTTFSTHPVRQHISNSRPIRVWVRPDKPPYGECKAGLLPLRATTQLCKILLQQLKQSVYIPKYRVGKLR